MEEKELIVTLIADHLRHSKLLTGFEELGFDVLDYQLFLPETIMKILEIESETIFVYYMAAVEIACRKGNKYKDLAEDIYEDLTWMKEELKN